MLRLMSEKTSNRLAEELIVITDDKGNECRLGNLSYIFNRANIDDLIQYSSNYNSEFILDYIFGPLRIIFTNDEIFTEERSLDYINLICKLKDLKFKSKTEKKEELFNIIPDIYNNLDMNIDKNLTTFLPKKHVEAINVVFYCTNHRIIETTGINKDLYLNLIDVSLSLKYTLPMISCFPSISNLELYTELYRRIIQEYFHDVYCKINELIKYRIRNNFTEDRHQNIYKYYSTIIETDIFMSIIMYYNMYEINSDNNLLNMVSFRIDDILNDIGDKYIINFIINIVVHYFVQFEFIIISIKTRMNIDITNEFIIMSRNKSSHLIFICIIIIKFNV